MNLVTLTGIRGGVGTSTVAALLGEALHALGQRVLLVDLNASDTLRLHFNVPYTDSHGWVGASFPKEWRGQSFRIEPGLCLSPFGRKAIDASGLSHLLRGEDFWLEVLPELEPEFDWLLFDCPALPYHMTPALRFRSALDVVVVRPDVAAHVLLAQYSMKSTSHLLINAYDATRRLESDVVLDWRRRYRDRLVPILMHLDECVHEALAYKTTVVRYRPGSATSRAARQLARWCMAAC